MKFKSEKYCRNINCNNAQLLRNFHKLEDRVLNNKRLLEKKLKVCSENEYLNIYIARLAYEFAKEEKEILFNEMMKRGLITNLNKGA